MQDEVQLKSTKYWKILQTLVCIGIQQSISQNYKKKKLLKFCFVLRVAEVSMERFFFKRRKQRSRRCLFYREWIIINHFSCALKRHRSISIILNFGGVNVNLKATEHLHNKGRLAKSAFAVMPEISTLSKPKNHQYSCLLFAHSCHCSSF